MSANYFSFNSPNGMCLPCAGRGIRFELVLERLVPDGALTLRQVLAHAGMLSSFQYMLKGRLKQHADAPFSGMPHEAQERFSPFGRNLNKEALRKTRNLLEVGLGHLTPYREIPTLSGGEMQRLFLSSHLDSKMESLIYILDEPTVGLHEVEKAGLLDQITALRDLGNTVLVVEHDRNTIERADHVIDFGPLAGGARGTSSTSWTSRPPG